MRGSPPTRNPSGRNPSGHNPSGRNPSGNAPSAQRCYRVALTERASIVARGEQLELWFVRLQDGWVRAIEHPDARVEQQSTSVESSALGSSSDATRPAHDASESASERCPSGTIWVRTTELMLPAGTRLLQRQSAPRPRQLSVMNYLKQGLATTQRVVRERHFVVTGNYRLMPVGRMLVNTVPGASAAAGANAESDASSAADDSESLSEIA